MGSDWLKKAGKLFAGDAQDARPRGQEHRDRGDTARDRGDWSDAVAEYRAYLTLNPQNFAIWVQLGHASKEAGDPDAAEQAYLRAEAIDDSDSDLQLNLGHLMKARYRPEAALARYRRSFGLDGSPQARIELGVLGQDLQAETRSVAAAKPISSPFQSRPVGTVDTVVGFEVRGWATNPDNPSEPPVVELVSESGEVLGSSIAFHERIDVARADLAEVRCGFRIFADVPHDEGVTVPVQVRLRDTGEELEGSPVRIIVPQADQDDDHVTTARHRTVKPLERVEGEHAIFVAYAATGMVQPFVRRYLEMLRNAGIRVSLVVNTDRPVLLDEALLESVTSAVVRENRGYDFGAWAHMLHLEPHLYGATALYIINDSVFGPRDEESFAKLMEDARGSDADLLGLTQTLDRGWHIQSYFMRVSKKLLASYAFQFFVRDIRVVRNKDVIIDCFEVPLARRVREAGFEVAVLFDSEEARNPTLYDWKPLLAKDFPYAKLLLLKGAFPHIDTRGMRKRLERDGFDMELLDATLRYGTDEPPRSGDFPLLAIPRASGPDDDTALPPKPYKVAFYGPWNYDNGLGSASRGIIGAIRRAEVRLNLHPILKPFHVHAPLGPPHDVIDFEGPADIAVVHLNPDSWHLLTDAQRRDIARAGKRIGYWVWEMEHLPPGWRREFSSVDRIWAPSTYCAKVFAAEDEAPVDVVPHAVGVEDASARRRARTAVLGSLGLDPDHRVILYVFDGSSYLVRKNPAALVRAFEATGLAERGWTLVLKTKHLMDRPKEGAAFASLVERTDGAVLLDRPMASGELLDLVSACDIYASPHASEGFGLTVAEAMAAGRTVIATNYGGTRQFLDETCGYPVAYEPWTLEEDYGHYTEGGRWARIDEEALADALTDAASRTEAGDTVIADAARRRIAEVLSIDTVGAAIANSFDAAVSDTTPIRRTPARIETDREAGTRLDEYVGGATLAVLPLDPADLSPLTADALDRVADDRDSWLMLAPADARAHPLTAQILAKFVASRPDAALVHADDVALGEPTLLEQVRLKTEFDPWLFAARDCVGAPLFVRGSALHALGGLKEGPGALFDLVLRAADRGFSIARLPQVLMVSSGTRPILPAATRRELLSGTTLYAGYDVGEGLTAETLRLEARFDSGEPPITLCVPTRRTAIPGERTTYVERLLNRLASVDWPMDRLTVLIGDDVAGAPDWAARDWPFRLRRIETTRAEDEPFNYSAKMNRLWRAAETELVVLMNDDVVARDGGWLRALAGFATDAAVGGVGARLLFDDGTIQHAGMVGGIMGTSVHAWLGKRADAATYGDWALVHRQWSIVTGAVFATRKSVLSRVGGFDEGFALEFNDVDLCLKIRQAGYRIMYTPFAEMTHSEKASRGETMPPGQQVARFLSRWQAWLRDDPAFHPAMRRDLIDPTPAVSGDEWYI